MKMIFYSPYYCIYNPLSLYYFSSGSNLGAYTFLNEKITFLVWKSILLQDFDPESCLA